MDMDNNITGITPDNFSSEELIKVNGMAEAMELNKAREAIRESGELLRDIKSINLRNIEFHENMNSKLSRIDTLPDSQVLEDSLSKLESSISDAIHKEDVRLYKNVQATTEKSVTEQKDKLIEEFERIVDEKMKSGSTKNSGLTFLIVLTLLTGLANLGFWVAYLYGYIRF